MVAVGLPNTGKYEESARTVGGSVPIEDLKSLLQVPNLPGEQDGRFRTIAGFVIYNLHKIPSEGEQFTWEDIRFEVVDMDGNRIDKVLVVPSRAKIVLNA